MTEQDGKITQTRRGWRRRRRVSLRISGNAEKLFEDLNEKGFEDRDVVATALGILDLVHRTGRVALLKQDVSEGAEQYVDSVLEVYDRKER